MTDIVLREEKQKKMRLSVIDSEWEIGRFGPRAATTLRMRGGGRRGESNDHHDHGPFHQTNGMGIPSSGAGYEGFTVGFCKGQRRTASL